MADRAFVLFAGGAGWRLGVGSADGSRFVQLDLAEGGDARQIAANASATLRENGHAGEAVLLAIPSSWCFSASIDTADLPKHDRKAMLYRLEEKLPLVAEGLVADFMLRGGGAALGVCARVDVVEPLIAALEARHIAVQSVAPTALLAAQGLGGRDAGASAVLICGQGETGGEALDVMAFDAGVLSNWALLPRDAADVQMHLGMASMALTGAPTLESCGVDEAFARELEKVASAPVQMRDTSPLKAAMIAAGDVLRGRRRAWIDLRRGPLAIRDALRLHRRPLNAALAAAVLLMLSVSAALLVRTQRYTAVEASANRQMSDAFREQFPGWETPPNVRVIVESEHRKAAAASSLGASSANRSTRSALQTFLDVLGRLPTERRISITKMSFDEISFELEGQVRTYEQLDGIAAAARRAGMDVAAPESRKNAAGFWDFTVRGTSAPAASAQVAKGGG